MLKSTLTRFFLEERVFLPEIKFRKSFRFKNYIISFMKFILLSSLLFLTSIATSQVSPDTLFDPVLNAPAYPKGQGPLIHVDAAHHNYHTASDRFAPFAKVLQNDGYKVSENTMSFDQAGLSTMELLVISNAINEANWENWSNPTLSAFTQNEIAAVKNWVQSGGKLLLIADHMPFAGAAKELAAAFGFKLCNCFAMDNRRRNPEIFLRSDSTLLSNEISNGNSTQQEVDSILTFTGSAFKIPKEAIPILKLKNYSLLSPEQAWQFKNDTPHENSDDHYQAAALQFGKGKLVLMGEAAMFTAQLAGNQKIGMNSPLANYNTQLLRNTISWLMK